MDLHTPTIEIKGIGPKTVNLYDKLGLNEAEDFLYYFPRDYMKYEEPKPLTEDCVGEIVFFPARVVKKPLLKRGARMQVVTATLSCEGMEVRAVWFRMPYLTKSLKPGETYIFRSRIERSGTAFHVEQPLIFTREQYEEISGTLQPVYALTKGLSNHTLKKVIRSVFDSVYFPDTKEWEQKKQTLFAMHFPSSFEELGRVRKSLVYEEFFLFILRLRLLKAQKDLQKNDFMIYPTAYAQRIVEHLPYALTDAQKRVWNEVLDDLGSDHSMSRLIQGDVGSGKTIIAILAMITVACSGYQTALMAPTEILATQHFEAICKIIQKENIPVKAVLLTGAMKASQKKEAYEMIASNEAQIVIGTHALFQEKVIYHDLALVITDEQHRFGVRQRELLSGKNVNTPHVLVMSATPIPRTLAIILYGDLDVSLIDEMPQRRLAIKNCVVGTDYRATAYRFMEKEIANGHQVYIICPLVEESEGLDCENVIDYSAKIHEVFAHNPSIRIGVLHGRMKAQEKNTVMEAFYRNDIQILVSTTVVEVGVNVPNATVMLIENSERFGLSQLHQLRGRIGRGDQQSYCIFMCAGSSSNKRLQVLNKSNDGFYIANEDLKQRGPGELFGLRQSGDLNFTLGDIIGDAEVLKQAAHDVDELLKKDPDLSDKQHAHYLKELQKRDEKFYHTIL